MLIIATDLQDTRWLQYLWGEFARLQRAGFAARIVPLGSEVESGTPVLYYTREFQPGCWLPNLGQAPPRREVQWLSPEIFLADGQLARDARCACPYDPFWNAFACLSRLEEYLEEKRGGRINSYARNHPRLDKATFAVPVVNHLFNALEGLIRAHFPALPFGAGEKPVIELSHDLDYIEKTVQLRLKQTVFNCFNTLKAVYVNPGEAAGFARRSLRFLLASPSYWCFNYWEDLEKRYNRRSVFYIYARTGARDWRTWLFDPSYDIAANAKLQQQLRRLLAEGFEVGLHGSWHSAVQEGRLAAEKALLGEVLQREVTKTRQHWLKYSEAITPGLHHRYFQFDSTLGWNDLMGFRSGCASRYRPYDHGSHKALDYQVTPLVVMDSTIFDYGAAAAATLAQEAFALLEKLGQFKTSHVSISWHQRVCSPDYGWHGLYEQILSRIA